MFRKDGMGIGIRLIKLPNDQKNNTERISTGQNNHRKVKMNRNSVSMLSYKNFGTCLSSLLKSRHAGLSIEAAIVLPLFIFMMFILMFPLKVMEDERRLQNTLETVGKQLASAEYIKDIGEDMIKKDDAGTGLIGDTLYGIEAGVALGTILSKTSDLKTVHGAFFTDDTSVFSGDDEAMFRAVLKYEVSLPFSIYSIRSMEQTAIVNRRAWIGSKGGRGRSKYGDDTDLDAAEDEDRIVYLGKTSTVYHDDPKCHYLSNVMKSTDASHIGALRNENGAKYHACPSCKPGKNGTVYYFASGTAYHSSESCKAISSYSRAVHLSEVGDMRACSYCGKKHAS